MCTYVDWKVKPLVIRQRERERERERMIDVVSARKSPDAIIEEVDLQEDLMHSEKDYT